MTITEIRVSPQVSSDDDNEYTATIHGTSGDDILRGPVPVDTKTYFPPYYLAIFPPEPHTPCWVCCVKIWKGMELLDTQWFKEIHLEQHEPFQVPWFVGAPPDGAKMRPFPR